PPGQERKTGEGGADEALASFRFVGKKPKRALARYIEQEPGGPPQRPQVGTDVEEADLLLSDATAKTLRDRAVLADPHCGHFALTSPLIVRCSCSHFAWHFSQVYS